MKKLLAALVFVVACSADEKDYTEVDACKDSILLTMPSYSECTGETGDDETIASVVEALCKRDCDSSLDVDEDIVQACADEITFEYDPVAVTCWAGESEHGKACEKFYDQVPCMDGDIWD